MVPMDTSMRVGGAVVSRIWHGATVAPLVPDIDRNLSRGHWRPRWARCPLVPTTRLRSVVLPASRHAPCGRGSDGRSTRDVGTVLIEMSFHDVWTSQALLHISPELNLVWARYPTLVYVSALKTAQPVRQRLQRLIRSHAHYSVASQTAPGGPFGPPREGRSAPCVKDDRHAQPHWLSECYFTPKCSARGAGR